MSAFPETWRRSVARRPWIQDVFAVLALMALAGLAFGVVAHCEFIDLDDDEYVTANPHVQQGITTEGASWALTAFHSDNWHPLTWLSHMLDWQLFGAAAGAHHLMSLLLHSVNSCLLYYLWKRMTGSAAAGGVIALLFALHPVHVESVAWVSERKDVLSTLWWLLALLSYLGYAERRGARRYVVTLACFALGLLSKPMVVTLPFVLLLLDIWPLRRLRLWPDESTGRAGGSSAPGTPVASAWTCLCEKIPFLVLSLGSCAVTVAAQRSGGAIVALDDLGVPGRLANALVSYVLYLRMIVWPENLALLYPVGPPLDAWRVGLSGLALLGVTLLFLRQRRRRPHLLVCWLWFLGTLVPVIGVVQVGARTFADRYLYIPSIGLFALVTLAAIELVGARPARRRLAVAVVVVVACALTLLTRRQASYWKDSETLYAHTLAVTGNNTLMEILYARKLMQLGRVDEGLRHFREAVRVSPRFGKAYGELGLALEQMGDVGGALDNLRMASRLMPSEAFLHREIGVLLSGRQDFGGALSEFLEAVRLDPSDFSSHNEAGRALGAMGKPQEAAEQFRTALTINPDCAPARRNLERAEAALRLSQPR